MEKACPVCDCPLKDGDDVVAIMATKFKMIPSAMSYAIEQPHRCIEIVHDACFDYEEWEDENDE